MSDTCRSCGAPIKWVQLASGKRMPIDAQGQPMVLLSEDGLRGAVRKVHASYFATCPDADKHRKQGGS